MTILVDMDDVLEGLVGAWVDYLNLKYGTQVRAEDIVEWNVDEYFPSLTHKQVHGVLKERAFWDAVKPLHGAQEGLKRLIDAGHEVYIVTNSHYKTVAPKMERVLFKYFPYLKWSQVILTAHKQMVRGDVLIDDGIQNLEGGEYEKILMDAPHNHEYNAEANGMYRVCNWDDILNVITYLNDRPVYKGVKQRS